MPDKQFPVGGFDDSGERRRTFTVVSTGVLLALAIAVTGIACSKDESSDSDQKTSEKNQTPALSKPAPDAGGPDKAAAVEMHNLGASLFSASLESQDPIARDDALVLLEDAVRNDPDNNLYKVDLGDAYVQLGRDVSICLAIDLYEDALSGDPKNDGLASRISDAYRRLGNYDAAFAFASQRLSGQGDQVFRGATQIAMIALESGKLDRGIKLLEDASRNHPDNHAVSLLLATLQAETGKKTQSLAIVEGVIKAAPDDSLLAVQAEQMKERIAK